MNRHRVFNWLLALAIGAMLAIVSDQPEPPRPVEVRTGEQLSQENCGPGASLIWLDDGTLTCRMHNGRGKATVVAGAKS